MLSDHESDMSQIMKVGHGVMERRVGEMYGEAYGNERDVS